MKKNFLVQGFLVLFDVKVCFIFSLSLEPQNKKLALKVNAVLCFKIGSLLGNLGGEL